jgi:hypothetical protein
MAARPPSNDIDDEPDATEFGIVALDAAVDDWDVSFPITRRELADSYGEKRLAVGPSGHEVSLDSILADCPRETFERKQDLLNELHPIFEERRERISGSILSRLRAMVPF